jgi:hypothetical protein
MPDETTLFGGVSYIDTSPPSDTYDTATTLVAQIDYTSLDGEVSDTVYNDPSNIPDDILERLSGGGGGGGSSQKGQTQQIIILNDTKAALDILQKLNLGAL